MMEAGSQVAAAAALITRRPLRPLVEKAAAVAEVTADILPEQMQLPILAAAVVAADILTVAVTAAMAVQE